MLLLINMQGGLSSEMDKHYIFLIPASPHETLFATLSDIQELFDGSLLFILSGILFKAPINTIVLHSTYVLFGAVYLYSDL